MHYYITTLKSDLEYQMGHFNELTREIRYCVDKNVLKLLELELRHTRALISRTKKTMKEMETL